MIFRTIFSAIVLIVAGVTLRAGDKQAEQISEAARSFSVSQARDSQYALDKLESGKSEIVGSSLSLFEVQYPKLAVKDRFLFAMLILANYNLEGEYSFRFGMMVKTDKAVIAKKIEQIRPENVALFLKGFPSTSVHEFTDRCEFYFSVKPSAP